MPKTRANGIDIEYETFGKPGNCPLILIMGLGSQLVSWPVEFCEKLVTSGHFVVRFDNRDVGLSSKFDDAGIPNVWEAMAAIQAGRPFKAPYRLSDMAADTVGLMDSLNIPKAHICGLSMGGMIAQTIAIEHPKRVISLISMESTTGEPGLPPPKSGVREAMVRPPPPEREGYVQNMVEVFRLFAGGSDKFDEEMQRETSRLSYDRSVDPGGFARQFTAIMVSGSRKKALASVTVPSLAIHGTSDALLPWEHGKATADAIAGTKLLMIEGLGHGIAYPGLWDKIVEAITAHTKTAQP